MKTTLLLVLLSLGLQAQASDTPLYNYESLLKKTVYDIYDASSFPVFTVQTAETKARNIILNNALNAVAGKSIDSYPTCMNHMNYFMQAIALKDQTNNLILNLLREERDAKSAYQVRTLAYQTIEQKAIDWASCVAKESAEKSRTLEAVRQHRIDQALSSISTELDALRKAN